MDVMNLQEKKKQALKRWHDKNPEYNKRHAQKMRDKKALEGDRTCNKCRYFRNKNLFSYGNYYCKYCNSYNHALRSDTKKHLLTCTLIEWITICELSKCIYCEFTSISGLDRIDNRRGHEKDNLVPCCVDCNYTRGDIYSFDEMKYYLGPVIKQIRINRENNAI